MTQKFLYALLRANKSQQDAFYAQQVPRQVFKDCQSEIRWVYEFRDRNKYYPSLSAFRHRFPNTELSKTKDTIDVSFQLVLDSHLFSEVAELVDKAKSMYEGGRTMQEVIGYMRQASQDISTFDTGYIDLDVSKTNLALRRYVQRVASKKEGGASYDPSPWPSYNDLVGYSEYGEHNIITSRTSIGKTWIALNWAMHYARAGERVLIISKEMPSHQINDRLECLLFELSYPHFRKGILAPSDLGRWKRARYLIQKKIGTKTNFFPVGGGIIVTGQETITGVGFSHIVSKIQQYRPTVAFLDGAYLVNPEGMSRNANSVERFTQISNTMKRFCIAFKIIGYSIVQVNREAEKADGDTTPTLKNIYGADAWAQDADNVFILGGKRGSKVRIGSLAKGRESNVGEFSLRFELSPKPNFSELKTLKSTSAAGAVDFTGI